MIKNLWAALTSLVLLMFPLFSSASDVFPYDYKIDKLENGLTVVSIPMDNPYIISYYTIVRSGSRNEIEPGKSGFAHFFEHMMFKGTKNTPREKYDNFLTELGAGTNGYTSDDYTCYFVVFAGQENLEKVVKTEADRFINLHYNQETLKTEAAVIEGEYYSSVSNPGRRLYETLRHTAFEKHPYKHTTLGYLKDIQDMPNQFEYSQLYKKRFYAPDNTILLVVGDYNHQELIEFVKKYYSVWEPSNYKLKTPVEPAQKDAKRSHYQWPGPTTPRIAVAFHGPAFSDEKIDKAALDLLAEIGFSPSSPLYQRLVVEEQKCFSLYADFPDRREPHLLTFNALVKEKEDLPYVEEEIFKELELYKNELIPEDKLEAVKSNLKYSMARQFGTTDGTAGILAFYINLTTDPNSINKLFDLYQNIASQNIREMAQKYFIKTNSTVVTLTGGEEK
ncbi:MAG TPA: pitrilysin family protein [Acidobacteriota bacterium]|nr:pitrilysin family protein [Acidobacteriota bacterium]